MFTFKYEDMNGREYLMAAGSVSARRDYRTDGVQLIQVVARETDAESSRVIGIWGGRNLPHRQSRAEDGEAWANVYVMNGEGATVATYRYAYDLSSITEEDLPAMTDPEEPVQI